MPKAPPPYPREFREEAFHLFCTSGKSIGSLAANLGVAYETLRKWIKQHDVDDGNAPGVTSAEREELRKLRREVRVVREEREILRKADAVLRISFALRSSTFSRFKRRISSRSELLAPGRSPAST